MKKILYIVSNPFSYSRNPVGGNISSATGVINGFKNRGYKIDVVTDVPIPTLEVDNVNIAYFYFSFRLLRMRVPYGRNGWIGKALAQLDGFLFRMAMRKTVRHLVKSHEYEFCYMRASYNGHGVTRTIAESSTRLVLEVNKPLSMGPFNNKESSVWPEIGQVVKVPFAERNQYDFADLITVDSSARANWISEFVGKVYAKKMIVNFNGVNTDMFSPKPRTLEQMEMLNISQRDFVVGMASSFRWYNDIDELCKILECASKEIRNLKIIIAVGDKARELELKSKISQHGLDGSTNILAKLPFKDMPTVLNCCDILLSHFNFHGKWPHNCSIKHLEYLSLGKPTVATDVGEVNFAVEHGVNGLLCREGDVAGFVNAIVRLANDLEFREKLGSSGRSKALQELSWEGNVDRIIDSLESAC